MGKRTRAWRRAQARRHKDKTRRHLRRFFDEEPTAQMVGMWTSTHRVPCSCFGCQYPKGAVEPMSERIAALQEHEQLEELEG